MQPLSVSQASLQVNVPKRTIQAAITRGALKAYKLPGATSAYLISPDDLATWLSSRSQKAAS